MRKNNKYSCPHCGSRLTKLAAYDGVLAEDSCNNSYCIAYGEEQNQESLDREEMYATYGNLYGIEDSDD